MKLWILAALLPLAAQAQPISHKVLTQDKSHVVILDEKGDVEWELPVKHTSHDMWRLPNGNLLLHMSDTTIVEMTPAKEIVWKHESKPTEGHKAVQIHAFQRLPNGSTMISESGNARIIEVDKD